MKTYMVCIAAFMLGWCNLALGAETAAKGKETAKAANTETETNWDLLLENSDVAEELAGQPDGAGMGPGPVEQRPGMDERPRMGGRGRGGRGMGPAGGPGMGPGPGAGMDGEKGPGPGPGAGPDGGDRPRWGMGDPEQLLEFLNEHEPQLAEKLGAMEKENPQAYRRKMRDVARIYGPIMVQMRRDPEMANLSLQKVRLILQQQQQLNTVNEAGAEKADLGPLRETVGKLFDIIVAQQEHRMTKIKERMEGMPVRQDKEKAVAAANRRAGRLEHFKDRLQQRQGNLENWKKNRDKLVEDRVQQLLQGIEPFPWH